MINEGKILMEALISEKATDKQEQENCFVFKVAKSANKLEIKKAVEKAFNVKVRTVKTAVVKGKNKRLGRFEGKRPDWKKAYVWLKEGETIELIENV